MLNRQNKKKTFSKRKIARKVLMPEFNNSFLSIKVAIDNFVRMIAHMFLSAGLLDEEDDVFNYNSHLGWGDFGEIIVVAAKNINWKSIHSIPQICLWLSSVLIVVFAISILLVVVMSLATSASMAATSTSDLNAQYDDLFTLSDSMSKTEYGTTWLNWLFSLDNQPTPEIVQARHGLAPGLRSMLIYYSSSCLVLGSIMVSYLFVNVVIDTASTGKFMGQADEVWAFPRILMAMCFLVPYGNSGLNIGQHVVIYVAKTGSIFATNAWSTFLNGMATNEDNIPIVNKSDIDLDEATDIMFDSFVCYWATQIGSMVMTGNTDKYRDQILEQQEALLKELENDKPSTEGLPSSSFSHCQFTKRSFLYTNARRLFGYPQYTGFFLDECEKSLRSKYRREILDKEIENEEGSLISYREYQPYIDDLARAKEIDNWKKKYNQAASAILNNSYDDEIIAGIEPKSGMRNLIYYQYDIGGFLSKESSSCGSYGPTNIMGPLSGLGRYTGGIIDDLDNVSKGSYSFENDSCFDGNPKLSSAFSCAKDKIKGFMKFAYINALNAESVFGTRKTQLTDVEQKLRLQTPSPKDFNSRAVKFRLAREAEKTIEKLNPDEKIEIKGTKKLASPDSGSLSSYALDLVIQIFKNSPYKAIIPENLVLVNEESENILDNNTIIIDAKNKYKERFKENMKEGLSGANQAFANLNAYLFGKNSSGGWNSSDIGVQLEKGWVAAGAFYSLLSNINGIGLEAITDKPYFVGPNPDFIGTTNIDSENYDPDADASEQKNMGTSSKVKFLDLIMTQNEKIKNDIEKETEGRSDSEGALSSYIGIAVVNGVLSGFGLGDVIYSVNGANPVSSLVSLGHKLINISITAWIAVSSGKSFIAGAHSIVKNISNNAFAGIPFAIASGVTSSLKSMFESISAAVVPVLLSFLSFGFTLAYYLPLIPFLKFFMGAIAWFASVFQAVLGMPMLMLGSISTAKDGMILGPKRGKYMMVVEIFFRPILMVFGMIGAILMLSLATYIFTDLYDFAWGIGSSTISHFIISPTTFIAGIAYVGIYVTTMYSIANTCFKMIDDVPKQVISWMGGGAGYDMGGPEAAENQAQAGLKGAAQKIADAQGGIDETRKKKRDKENQNKDNMNEIMQRGNELGVTHGPEARKDYFDSHGVKEAVDKEGNPVLEKMDKNERTQAEQRLEARSSLRKAEKALPGAQDDAKSQLKMDAALGDKRAQEANDQVEKGLASAWSPEISKNQKDISDSKEKLDNLKPPKKS